MPELNALNSGVNSSALGTIQHVTKSRLVCDGACRFQDPESTSGTRSLVGDPLGRACLRLLASKNGMGKTGAQGLGPLGWLQMAGYG